MHLYCNRTKKFTLLSSVPREGEREGAREGESAVQIWGAGEKGMQILR